MPDQVDYTALAKQAGAVSSAPPAGGVDYDALAKQAGAVSAEPTFKQSDTSPNEVDPNTVGTLARHLWSSIVAPGQLLPFPKALGGSGMDNPLLPSNILKSAQAIKAEGDKFWDKGDKVAAAAKYVESLIPIFGPALSNAGNQIQHGKIAALAGDIGGMVVGAGIGSGLSRLAGAQAGVAPPAPAARVAPTNAADVAEFAKARGIPVDAATVSDNLAVKGAQALADRSIGGSLVATPANAARAEAMTRVGGELADETGAAATTPEQAGTTVRNALTAKIAGHTQAANAAYDSLRHMEADPSNHVEIPTAPAPVDALNSGVTGQLRRIVHELDASGYTASKLVEDEHGSNYVPRSGGAAVYDDILQSIGTQYKPTRGALQAELEDYLGGGKETAAVKGALDVARQRLMGRAQTLSTPELPASAMQVPTRLESARQTSQTVGLPVDTSPAKVALQPLYDQMKRQMPITQQQSSAGLKAIQNILEGPDVAPLSQVDRDLSAIKSVAREQGGIAKAAVAKLDAAVRESAQMYGGPDVWKALQEGRQATIAKYAASDVLDTLHDEPVKTISRLTAPKDSAIQQLRTVTQQVPQMAPEIARGYLEDLLEKPNRVAEWNKLGSETKGILFPKAGQAEALDRFFALTKRISDTNVNPSGSGYVAALGAQGAMLWYDPLHAIPLQITGAVLSKLLRSPAAVNALTRGLSLPASAPMAARTVATANLIRAAQSAGVSLDFPKAAANQSTDRQPQP